jgi:predicted MFS family arabinose efflux permease
MAQPQDASPIEDPRGGLSGYWQLLRTPVIARLVVSVFPGRIGYAMVGLAMFFHVHQRTGSIARAGLTIGVSSLASSLTAGLRGAVIDRLGQTRPLQVLVPAYAAALIATSLATDPRLLLLGALAQGLMAPPINLSSRPLWKIAVGERQLRTGYALDSVFMNSAQVVGPSVATAIALGFSGATALRVVAACMIIGGTLLMTMPLSRQWRPEPRLENEPSLFRSPAIRLLALDGAIFGFGIGIFGVAIPAATTLAGRQGLTAPILSGMSLAGIIGGLVAGVVARRVTPMWGNIGAYSLIALAFAPLALTQPGWSMGIVIFIAGLFLGAGGVYHWEVIEAVRPRGTAVGALSWIWTVEGSMGSLGSAVGGALSESHGPSRALAVTSIMTGVGALLIYIRRDLLAAADRLPTDEEAAEAIADTAGQ